MGDYKGDPFLQGTTTMEADPVTPTQASSLMFSQDSLPETVPATPGTSQISEPPTQPPNPPKIRIKRRRAIFPPTTQPFDIGSSETTAIPAIETTEVDPQSPPLPITPASCIRHHLTHPSPSSSSQSRKLFPPRTPVHQIYASIEHVETPDQEISTHSLRKGAEIERPLSALSVFSDSSVTSQDSSDSGPSFGGSCTSPESESSDPFVFNEAGAKPNKLSAPFSAQQSQHSRKRQKIHKKIKWTADMDEHLWMTYIVYLSDPTVTPFKTLPGSAPPLGVCHRVAREAKRSWKGPRNTLHTVSATDSSRHQFTSLDATIMREMSAPPIVAFEPESEGAIETQPPQRSHSSNEITRKHVPRWPRSEASTRRRLRELCKHKPILSPHYQRLMQTRTPSPFESSSSRSKFRSSRTSPPVANASSGSSFSTRDLNITLATSTSSTMQPGGPLSQLASDIETPCHPSEPPSAHSSIRGAHQKSQSLQLTLGVNRDWSNSLKRLASPFQESSERQVVSTLSSSSQESSSDTGTAMDRDATPKPGAKLDSPLQIHAPRPMSGSMKRRAEYQLGEELIANNVDARRNFLEDLFSDGHRRVRSRGFSLGAMRQAAPPSRHLSDVFTRPTATEEPEDSTSDLLALYTQTDGANENEYHVMGASGHSSGNNLAPPSVDTHTRRLGSPFAPHPTSSFRNTFPRSLFPQGLESISSFDHQSAQNNYGLDVNMSTNNTVFDNEQSKEQPSWSTH